MFKHFNISTHPSLGSPGSGCSINLHSSGILFVPLPVTHILNLSSDTDRIRLMNAMDGHILAWGELLGIYR
jgi:hypothetical protein